MSKNFGNKLIHFEEFANIKKIKSVALAILFRNINCLNDLLTNKWNIKSVLRNNFVLLKIAVPSEKPFFCSKHIINIVCTPKIKNILDQLVRSLSWESNISRKPVFNT